MAKAFNLSLRPDGYAVRVKTVGASHIEVFPMIFTDRLVMTPFDDEMIYARYWCYDKNGAAVLAAPAWDGADDTEQVGWKKAH